MNRRKILLALTLTWIGLLVLSTGYRAAIGFKRIPLPDQKVAQVPTALSTNGHPVALAYRHYPASGSVSTPILLLHGNPMAGRAMQPLAEAIHTERDVLVPDLPGLGFTSRNLPAYSAENQVRILLTWLDQLNIEKVHLMGYSQGGPVALELIDRAPERVASVALFAAVGLQEHELLGSYELNQPLYSLYYAAAWSIRWLTPHFGALDDPVFATTTVENFADTDLRRCRPILETFEQPALILHSTTDRLVPYAAAISHATLAPHSIFKDAPGGHMGPFSEPETYANELREFIALSESGTAPTRASASALRGTHQPGLHAQVPKETRWIKVLILGTLLFLIVYVSEDLACITGGILAATGAMPLPSAILACFLGIWVSDLLIYAIGHCFGARALESRWFRRINPKDVDRFRTAYGESGLKIVFITRFIPGSRVIAYLTAGMLRLGYLRFSLWLFLAAAVWTPILVSIAYAVGHPLIDWWTDYGLKLLPLIALCIIALYLAIGILSKAFTYRGRAELRGRWIRLTRWEYWPALPIYLPVAIYALWLMLRYRSLTVWALCNPNMQPLSGLAMESKSVILSALNSDSGKLPSWRLIPEAASPEERIACFKAFQTERSNPWPVILKPDIGQRGEGVAVIRNEAEAERYLLANPESIIAQAYVTGPEFGVFYYKHPGVTKGRIFSITEKVLPQLTGDGVRTLEQLILDDPRAVAQAKHYLKVNAERIQNIPTTDETIQLVELGTHCRGAIFLDGSRLASDALAAALDEVLTTYDGFYFGRFDLRVSSPEALSRGEAFYILELNGVSSESTDIYDPKNHIIKGWKKLCRQWALAFEIGAANRDAGHPPPSLKTLFRTLRRHRERDYFEAADL
ncbi:MAG: alpha/beta fold hydrolase [Verrucomicrobiota bacterium]